MENQAAKLQQESVEAGEERTRAEGELGVEREWRVSLEQSVNKDRNRIAELQRELTQLREVSVVRFCDYLLSVSFVIFFMKWFLKTFFSYNRNL